MAEQQADRRAFRIVEEAFQKPSELRAVFLEEALAGREELREPVEELLRSDSGSGSFLEEPLIRGWEEASERVWIGRRIGAYRLLRLLGAGGTSRVYLGVREEGELSHQVAVKLLLSSVDGPEGNRRFEIERKVLATLEHPGIARFIDSGTTADGVPYLVMEYVAGSSITAYCDAHRLTVRERLGLFLDVCRAVQSAHQRLVVHRDIKPGNVLVTAEGRPKLLDFGVSKLLDPALGAGDETATRDRLLTPSYASPEQLEGKLVTTASDVYSLGVVLYELLTGALPRPQEGGRPAPGRRRASAAIDDEGRAASVRSTTTSTLRRQLAGDLDTITEKALRDEPEERYGTVEQFGEDVRRHLAGLPVLATRPRIVYRLRKFVRRNVAAVAAGTVAGIALVALLVSSLLHSTRLAEERDRALFERRRAEEVTRFLVRSFELADPGQARGDSLTAREVVERAAERVTADLGGHPDVEAEILTTLGVVYRGLGLYEESLGLLERALALRRSHGEDDPAATLRALSLSLGLTGDYLSAEARAREALALDLGRDEEATAADLRALLFALWGQRKLDEAEEAGREALRISAGIAGGDPLELVETQANLAVVLETKGDYDEAERLFRAALDAVRVRFGDDHPLLVETTNNLAWLLQQKGDFAAAERLQRESLALARRILGEAHPALAIHSNNLALLLQKMGDHSEAEALHREALGLRREALGDEHPAVARSLNNLGLALAEQGKNEEAAELYSQALELFRKSLGGDHPETANSATNLGAALTRLGRYAEAEGFLRDALVVRGRRLGQDHPDLGASCTALAKLLLATRRPGEAEELAARALAIYTGRLGEGHWRTAIARGLLGASLADQGDLAAAEPLLVESVEVLRRARGERTATVQWQLERLVDLYESQGRAGEAERYRSLLPR